MWKRFEAKVVEGHRVASGQNGNPLFPGGTIRMQLPFFKALGLDLTPYYPGTVNVCLAPLHYRVGKPPVTFRGVKWHPTDPAEDFSFFSIRRVFPDGSLLNGLIYYPHPETKPKHFQRTDVLELLFPFMDHVQYGNILTLETQDDEIEIKE